MPGASAHVTITATDPDATLEPGQTLEIDVSASTLCATVAAEYQAMGKDKLTFGLDPAGPTGFNTTADVVDFTIAQCDPLSMPTPTTATATGKLRLTALGTAPGLVRTPLMIYAFLPGSATPEGGTPASINVTVGFHANATIRAGAYNVATRSLQVIVDYQSNAAATLQVSGTCSCGPVSAPIARRVEPPSFYNLTKASATFDVVLAQGTSPTEVVKLAATLTAIGGTGTAEAKGLTTTITQGSSATSSPSTTSSPVASPTSPSATLTPGASGTSSSSASPSESKGSPGVEAPVLLLGLAGAALALARRKA